MPVVFKGLASEWPATSQWSFARLAEQAPEVSVQLVQGNRERATTSFVASTLKEYLQTLHGGATSGGTRLYLKEFDLLRAMPHLCVDLRYGTLIPRHHVRSLQSWIGPEGARTGLHCDYLDNVAVQITGSKRFHLFRPGPLSDLMQLQSDMTPGRGLQQWTRRNSRAVASLEIKRSWSQMQVTSCTYLPGGGMRWRTCPPAFSSGDSTGAPSRCYRVGPGYSADKYCIERASLLTAVALATLTSVAERLGTPAHRQEETSRWYSSRIAPTIATTRGRGPIRHAELH